MKIKYAALILLGIILISGCVSKEAIEEKETIPEITEGPGPNLIVSDIRLVYDPSYNPTPKYTHWVLIKNIGDAPANKSRAKVVIEPTQKQSVTHEGGVIEYKPYTGSTYPISASGKQIILPGEEATHTDYFQVEEEGTVIITVYADYLNQVLELNETDNELSVSFEVS